MGADLILFTRFLVDVRCAQDGEPFDPGRKRDRTADFGACAFGAADDIRSRLVDALMLVRFDADANSLGDGLVLKVRKADGNRFHLLHLLSHSA